MPPTQTTVMETDNQIGTVFPPLTSPVVFVIFNRPDLTEKVFEAIAAVKPSKLLVIADGPRSDEEAEKCQMARAVIEKVDWECEVLQNYADTNLGCRKRLSSGLDWVFSLVEEAIVLEDDCLPDSSFFFFCQELLERYRFDERVAAISGVNFQPLENDVSDSYFFSKYFHCWGWASWRRTWSHYDVEMATWPKVKAAGLLNNLLEHPFEHEYWSHRCDAIYKGQIDTWDYQYQYACWLAGGLTIIPSYNLVSNLGHRSDATHTVHTSTLADLPLDSLWELLHPAYVIRHRAADIYTFDYVHNGRATREAQTAHQDLDIKQLISGQPQTQTLAICMMVQNAEATLDVALTSLAGLWDELIVVDGGSSDETGTIAQHYGARIIAHPWPANHGVQRNVYLGAVQSDWVFVLDSDEFIDSKTRDFLQLVRYQGHLFEADNFWFPRKWISPGSLSLYLDSSPHFPDPQRRLFRFNQNVKYEGLIHELILGLHSEGVVLQHLSIYHLDLYINDFDKRKAKIERYRAIDSAAGPPEWYLPESFTTHSQPLDCSLLLTETVEQLKRLPCRCKICKSASLPFGQGEVLWKYSVHYYQCVACGFVQTEEPYWLEEAYTEAIAPSDVGILERNTTFSAIAAAIISEWFDSEGPFLDFGAGYGIFVRMMRDQGFDFRWFDKHCINLFAKGWEYEPGRTTHFDVVTAFEVFEHLLSPVEDLQQMLQFTSSILLSTSLLPANNPKPGEWWYYALHEGQHIALYTERSLKVLAERLGLNFYSNGNNLHLLTKRTLPENCLHNLTADRRRVRQSLTSKDFAAAIGHQAAAQALEVIRRVATGDAEAICELVERADTEGTRIAEFLLPYLEAGENIDSLVQIVEYLSAQLEFQQVWKLLVATSSSEIVGNSEFIQTTLATLAEMFSDDPDVAAFLAAKNHPSGLQ